MINIPLPFGWMWTLLLLGVLANMLAKIQKITDKTPEEVQWKTVIHKFFNREWPSYGLSFIITFVIAGSFQYMKKFEKIDNDEITKWAKWIPLAVPVLFLLGYFCQWIFYKIAGRIESKGGIDTQQLKDKPEGGK